MPTIETATWLALRARVESLPLSPALPISWPNENFTKPTNGGAYLRVNWIPNVNRRLFLDPSDPHQRLGILQIDVFSRRNQNAAAGIEIGGLIAQHFHTDLQISAYGVTASVTRAPELSQPLPDDTHWLVPVTIPIEVMA